MAREKFSPATDWITLDLGGLNWLQTGPIYGPLPASVFKADKLDATAAANRQKGAMWKPEFAPDPNVAVQAGYQKQIAIPDGIYMKQPGRLSGWSGLNADDMDIEVGRRVQLQVENVLVSLEQWGTPGVDLDQFDLGVKYRGYGKPDGGDQTQTAPICGSLIAGGATAFPNMIFPGDAGGDNDKVTFGPNGIARIQHFVEVPDYSGLGFVIDLSTLIVLGAARATSVQWYSAKYRFIAGNWSVYGENQGVQMLGTAGTDELEDQPMFDELPYRP